MLYNITIHARRTKTYVYLCVFIMRFIVVCTITTVNDNILYSGVKGVPMVESKCIFKLMFILCALFYGY